MKRLVAERLLTSACCLMWLLADAPNLIGCLFANQILVKLDDLSFLLTALLLL